MFARLGSRGALRPALLYLLGATSLLLAGVELALLLAVPGAPVVGTLLFTGRLSSTSERALSLWPGGPATASAS